ncbi:hypothetical protein BASA81_003131 [Batrachochytrium salamandrivorans]|nr:hypothetical protein BASA81_003131 [Batrachochytrium salamandrivorans]
MKTCFEQAVGKTQTLRLKWASEEYSNPGGSIKDRAALWMIREAERQGVLVRGEPGVVVEGTAGNTGIGLALAASTFGYHTVICLADTQSEEKKSLLRWSGAHLVQVPAVPFKNPNNYVHVAERLSKLLQGNIRTLYANQWDNPANQLSHFESTGPEIFDFFGDKLDAFSCAVGTGGTLHGTSDFLRSKYGSKVTIGLTDPRGASLVRYFNEGELRAEGSSISEGIGQGRITGNLTGFKPDIALEITDDEMTEALRETQKHDGLMLGGSAAVNVAGAIKIARLLGKDKNVCTVLCDAGSRYATKLYNPAFLNGKGLPVPEWLDLQAQDAKFQKIGLQEAVQKAINNV